MSKRALFLLLLGAAPNVAFTVSLGWMAFHHVHWSVTLPLCLLMLRATMEDIGRLMREAGERAALRRLYEALDNHRGEPQ